MNDPLLRSDMLTAAARAGAYRGVPCSARASPCFANPLDRDYSAVYGYEALSAAPFCRAGRRTGRGDVLCPVSFTARLWPWSLQ